jgi:hypothetical protein
MLEAGAALETWKLSAAPTPDESIPAEKSFDHRLLYLDYEGRIGGGRGAVTRWDAGLFEAISEKGSRANLPTKSRARSKRPGKKHRMIRIHGRRLNGIVEMTDDPDSGWTWHFSEDESAASEPKA